MSVLMVQQTLRFTPSAQPRVRKAVRLEPGRGGLRFTEISTANRRWDLFGMSAAMQGLVLFVLAWIPILYVQGPEPVRYTLTMMTRPLTEYEPPQRKPLPVRRATPPPVAPIEQAVKPALAMDTRIVAPKFNRRQIRPVSVPEMASPIRAAEMNLGNKPLDAPRPPVVTGMLKGTPGTSEQPTLTNKRVDEVQTGGFGDPNGVPAKGNPNKPANINRVGSFGLPPGHGYGNGTGGTKGARGVVESAGFGNGVSKGDPNARGSAGRGGVQGTSFGDAAPTAGAPASSNAAARTAKPERTPVEILHKPRPTYTEQARQMRIEGNVKLRVVFAASGELRIVGVSAGLGYGLDEAAIAAAQKIRFRPARENGRPVDEPAIVTIEFKLAY
jgi:TonB family protein